MTDTPRITADEWLEELRRLTNADRSDPGLTVEEIAVALGCCTRTALTRLRKARAKGWLVAGRKTVVAIDGRRTSAPVYRIVRPTAPTSRGA